MKVALFPDEVGGKNYKKNKNKSPLMNFFRRKNDDKNNNQTPPGKLFGHPLHDVLTGDGLPKSIMVSSIYSRAQQMWKSMHRNSL